jgi:2-dehydro-3-deoxyphosphogluconate aldolase / (4S)-4-hydroxy-2-oxoglutarate aldolase
MSMTIDKANQMILDGVILAGMRGAFPPATALKVCETMVEEEINLFEFTMNSQQPIEAMQAVKKQFGEAACVGMGTVLDVETARKVIDAGADFIVSPAFQPEVVEFVLSKGVFIAPGVITPSEAVAAWGMGVKMLKLFPIGSLGLDYFKAVFGPLDHMKFMCNGGMNDNNSRELIQAGAVAVGMASWLTGDGTWTDSRLRSRARVLVNAVAVARGESPKQEA